MSELPKDVQLAIKVLKANIDTYPSNPRNLESIMMLDALIDLVYDAGFEDGKTEVCENPLQYIELTDFAPERE